MTQLTSPPIDHIRDPRRRAACLAAYSTLRLAAPPPVRSHPSDLEQLAFYALCRAVTDLITYHDSPSPARRVLADDALWLLLEARYDIPERAFEMLQCLRVEDPALIARRLVRLFQWSLVAPEPLAWELLKRWTADIDDAGKAARRAAESQNSGPGDPRYADDPPRFPGFLPDYH